MYARIARSKDSIRAGSTTTLLEMKRQMDAGRSESCRKAHPKRLEPWMETVTRWVQLVDRKKGTAIGIAFSESEGTRGGQMKL